MSLKYPSLNLLLVFIGLFEDNLAVETDNMTSEFCCSRREKKTN